MGHTTGLILEMYQEVREAELPEPFALAAFETLLASRLGEASRPGAPPPPQLRGAVIENLAGVDGPSGDLLGKAAVRLGTSPEALGDLFDIETGVPELVVSARQLEQRTATAARQIAILVAAGRQAAGVEEWTPVAAIRETCTHYNRNDPSNFATTIASLSDVFLFRGSPRKREVKLSRPGWETAADLVRKLIGEERS
jgi:hypothetical protein